MNFKINECESMFREESDFSNDNSYENCYFFESNNHPLLGLNKCEEKSQGFESTILRSNDTKSAESFCDEDLKRSNNKPEIDDKMSVMASLDLFHLKDLINSNKTDLNDFLDDFVFFDMDVPADIRPLGEVQVSASKRKIRKSPAQIKLLKIAYENCDEWNKEYMTCIAVQTGLSEKQVYKWYASERNNHNKRLPKGCSKRILA